MRDVWILNENKEFKSLIDTVMIRQLQMLILKFFSDDCMQIQILIAQKKIFSQVIYVKN